MLLVLCNDFIMYFFRVLLLSGLQKIPLRKDIFQWVIIQKSAFLEGEKSVKDSSSYLWPHFPESIKPSFLSQLQSPPKECLSGLKFRVDETLGIKPLLRPTVQLHWVAWCLQPWSSFKQESWWAHSRLLCVLCCCFFVSLMIVFSPNNRLFGTIDSVSHCHGFAGK